MNDQAEFSLDVSVKQPLSHAAQVERYAFDDCKTYRLPERKLLIRNPNNGQSAVIMPEVLTALAQCIRFATKDDHIANVSRVIPQLKDHPDQVRQVLDNMVRDGMMVSAQSLCDRFNSVTVEEDPVADEAAVVAIITCDRPQAIERLLASVAENADPSGFETLYVIDDSRDPSNIERNRACVEAFNADSSIATVYFGRERQRTLMDETIAQAPENEESVRFLVDFERWKDEWTGGLARNYALLLSKGKRLVMLDDDVLFEVYEPSSRPAGINLRDEIREAEFFDEIGNWPGLKLRAELDPVKAHLYCLGLPLRQAMGRLGVSALLPEHLAGCTVSEIRRLEPEAPVLVTQCGSLGEPGVGNNSWIIELTGESRGKMLASEESVAHAIRNDNAWIGRRQPHIASRPNMSAVTGIDNRKPVPPYFPIQRGEDRMFGIMLAALFADAVALDYPWAVPHLAAEDRTRDASQSTFKGKRKFPEFAGRWLSMRFDQPTPRSRTGDFEALAGPFVELSEYADAQLTELHNDFQVQSACENLTELQSALNLSKNAPDAWQTFVSDALNHVNSEFQHVLASIAGQGDPEIQQIAQQDLPTWRERWGAFGEACCAWIGVREC
jgi:hypothetical protein